MAAGQWSAKKETSSVDVEEESPGSRRRGT